MHRNRDTAVPAEGNGELQTLICVLVARPWRCLTLSNPVPWQNCMTAYLGYTLRMKTLFRGWPVMVHDTHTRRRRRLKNSTWNSCCYFWHFWHCNTVLTVSLKDSTFLFTCYRGNCISRHTAVKTTVFLHWCLIKSTKQIISQILFKLKKNFWSSDIKIS